MSIETDVKVRNLAAKVDRLERLLTELQTKVELLTPPSKEVFRKKGQWTTENLHP